MTGTTPAYASLHLGEIILKGRNRRDFERRLRDNLRYLLGDLVAGPIEPAGGRMLVPLPAGAPESLVHERLACIHGVASYALVERHPLDLDGLTDAAVQLAVARAPASFAMRARRADKTFPLTSVEINRRVGAAVQRATGARVDLGTPELEIHLDVLPDSALLYAETRRGAGGLPVGCEGQVTGLISGGIDSPVAVARVLRRGCLVRLLHFHSSPFTGSGAREKVAELGRILARRQGPMQLDEVAFAQLQQAVVAGAPARFRILLYRRFMLRIAAAQARATGSLALVTGESLGQVASQTLHNLGAVDAVATLPVLRPLVGLDKQEIVDQARTLGTFECSIQPHDDCCSFMMPDRVATRASAALLEQAEADLDVPALVSQALATLTTRELTPS
jgi:thiamine biosynthesis protein ThiI